MLEYEEVRQLFGYVKVFKPQLRICEYETYKAVYCGLCKQIGKNYGLIPRMVLSYDFAFLTLMQLAVSSHKISVKKCRCIAHPLSKRPCVLCGCGFDYPAAAAQILIYHKLRDDKQDRGAVKKLSALLLLAAMKNGYKKARRQYPWLARDIEEQMRLQINTEKKRDCGFDEAAQPTAKMMESIAADLSNDERQKRVLARFGYFLGRFVYLCDAADDLQSDMKSGSFNPLVSELGLKGELGESDCKRVRKFVIQTLNLTLGELADCYVLLEIKRFRPILDNIVYMGLKASCADVLHRRFSPQNSDERKMT